MDEKTLAIALVAVLALAAVLYVVQMAPPAGGQQPRDVIGLQRFQEILAQTQNYSLIIDKRGSPSNQDALAVVQCGANLAGSLAAIGKNVKPFEYYGEDKCATLEKAAGTVAECEKALKGYVFRVSYGQIAKTDIYEDAANIFVNAYYKDTCSIASEQSSQAVAALNGSQVGGELNSSTNSS